MSRVSTATNPWLVLVLVLLAVMAIATTAVLTVPAPGF